jgi:predicted amidohydrolase YtcJ
MFRNGLWICVTRKMRGDGVFYPEERVSREEALRMYTSSAAWLQFSEKTRGTLEAGKLADAVVIDRDYLTCPEDQIREIEPVMTIVAGKIVFERRP